MKTLTIYLAVLVALFVVQTSSAEESDTTKVVKKIIKTIEVDENGKTIIDTTMVYEGDDVNVFVRQFPADCPRGRRIEHRMNGPRGRAFAWTDDENLQYDVTIETTDGDSSKVIVMRTPCGRIQDFDFGPDIRKHRRMMMMGDDANFDFNFDFDSDFPPMHFNKRQKSNMIDLNDPEIVSYEKETLKNGDEKITIVRKAAK